MENKYSKQLVAFIDILGFTEMVEEQFFAEKSDILDILKDALNVAENKMNDFIRSVKTTPIKIQFKQFSDCVSLSMQVISENTFLITLITFFTLVREYQQTLMEKNIFVRGGIAFDFHFEIENFIFSKGLIKAYKNESEIALYPRIVIDKDLVEIIKQEIEFLNYVRVNEMLNAMLLVDWDGICFLNPFHYHLYLKVLPSTDGFNEIQLATREKYLKEHQLVFDKIFEEVENNIDKFNKDYSKQRKYVWLKEFLIWHNTPNLAKINFKTII